MDIFKSFQIIPIISLRSTWREPSSSLKTYSRAIPTNPDLAIPVITFTITIMLIESPRQIHLNHCGDYKTTRCTGAKLNWCPTCGFLFLLLFLLRFLLLRWQRSLNHGWPHTQGIHLQSEVTFVAWSSSEVCNHRCAYWHELVASSRRSWSPCHTSTSMSAASPAGKGRRTPLSWLYPFI